nr:YhbY family RNA-binding protein [Oceanococcus sp. HetDA_MAG_MS8]
MTLNGARRRELRAAAHSLKPVVQLGAKGLTDAVHGEIDLALNAHELIKVRLAGMDKTQRRSSAMLIAERHAADIVGEIGNIAIFYRPQPEQSVEP